MIAILAGLSAPGVAVDSVLGYLDVPKDTLVMSCGERLPCSCAWITLFVRLLTSLPGFFSSLLYLPRQSRLSYYWDVGELPFVKTLNTIDWAAIDVVLLDVPDSTFIAIT